MKTNLATLDSSMADTSSGLRFGERRELPARRKGQNQKLTIIDGRKRIVIHLRTGNYPDGTLGEIFIDISQSTDETLRAMLNVWCIAVSLALQHGCPLAILVEQFTFTKFTPAGPVRDHARLKMCSSIADAVFRDIAIQYLDRQDLAHVPAGDK